MKKNDIVGLGIPAGYMFYWGFSQYMIVKESDIVLIPKGLSPADSAPLLCAGVTTYSALKNCGTKCGDLVAVWGVGGLGHLAIQYGNKMGFNIVEISRSEDKKDLAMKLGAKHYFSIEKGDFAKEIQNLGGVKAILLAGPSENIADKLIESIQEGGKLMLLGTNNIKMEFSINPIIFGKKSIQVGSALIMKLRRSTWNSVLKMISSLWLKFISLKNCKKDMMICAQEMVDLEMLLNLIKFN